MQPDDLKGLIEIANPTRDDFMFLRSLDEVIARMWIEVFGGYDYGATTAYLLRRYGPPNLTVLVHDKHGPTWAVPTDHEGVFLIVEPSPTKATAEHLAASNVIGLAAIQTVEFASKGALRDFLRQSITELTRPVGWRDRYATPAGFMATDPDFDSVATFFSPSQLR